MKAKVNKLKIILSFVLIIMIPILVFYILKLLNPGSIFFSVNETSIQEYVSSWGVFGPIIFILIQIFTIVFPPTPNLIPMIAGGLLFGLKLGVLYSFIGVMLGVTINFFLTRVFGRRIISIILNEREINSVDKFVDKINWRFIVLLPFIPGMYADLGGYSAGMSNIRFRKYFFSIGLGYLILIFLANVLGKIVIGNPILKGILIIILVGGFASIFIVPIVRYLKKKLS